MSKTLYYKSNKLNFKNKRMLNSMLKMINRENIMIIIKRSFVALII